MIVRRGSQVFENLPEDFNLTPPAVVLMDPKYPHNVGMVLRLCSCYGIRELVITGDRVDISDTVERLPREERMKGYADVSLIKLELERPFDILPPKAVPICVEFDPDGRAGYIDLVDFEHFTNAVYIFGPEDGGVSKASRGLCHHFVYIPTKHCLNLATAVATVLYDRHYKNERPVI